VKRITRKHLNSSITIDTRLGRRTLDCKIHKGLAVTPSQNAMVPGYHITHVATGKTVTAYTFKLNQAWSVLLALEPLTDWTRATLKDLAAAVPRTPSGFYDLVRRIVQSIVER